MATIYIEEYENFPGPAPGLATTDRGAPLAVQKITIAGTSAQSSALNSNTSVVLLTADTICQIAGGSNPTADASSKILPANVPRAYVVTGGHKIAVIAQQ